MIGKQMNFMLEMKPQKYIFLANYKDFFGL